jgi:hypothetical protein
MGEGEFHPKKAGKLISNKSQGMANDDDPLKLRAPGGKHTSEESRKW